MLNLNPCLKSNRLMTALTGLTIAEFQKLLCDFQTFLLRPQEEFKNRQRQPGGGRHHTLSTPQQKLFFILFYVKCYPTFDLLAFFLGVDRSQPCRWVQQYLGILQQVLGHQLVLPVRRISSVSEFLTLFPEVKEVLIDATERPIQRPKNKEKQKANYSDKKKRHTKKNLVMTDRQKRIIFLGETHEGKKHDKSAADEAFVFDQIPEDVTCWADKGFTGAQSAHPQKQIHIPKKKPPGKELEEEEKEKNKQMGRIRIKVEHAIGGVKRFRSVHEIFRNKIEPLGDQLMTVACGLWNYHLEQAA